MHLPTAPKRSGSPRRGSPSPSASAPDVRQRRKGPVRRCRFNDPKLSSTCRFSVATSWSKHAPAAIFRCRRVPMTAGCLSRRPSPGATWLRHRAHSLGADGFPSELTPGETPRNLMGFKDGSGNPAVHDQAAMARFVFVGEDGPPWMRGGSYVVARRILVALEHWDRMKTDFQERTFGRRKVSGARSLPRRNSTRSISKQRTKRAIRSRPSMRMCGWRLPKATMASRFCGVRIRTMTG